MVRRKGSGWGGGVMLYQICPYCNKKKVIYQGINMGSNFYCISYKERFNSNKLLHIQFKQQLNNK
jgi:ssDNA-binding Zn-finger/Zn-ribbon topoisomerase 1